MRRREPEISAGIKKDRADLANGAQRNMEAKRFRRSGEIHPNATSRDKGLEAIHSYHVVQRELMDALGNGGTEGVHVQMSILSVQVLVCVYTGHQGTGAEGRVCEQRDRGLWQAPEYDGAD